MEDIEIPLSSEQTIKRSKLAELCMRYIVEPVKSLCGEGGEIEKSLSHKYIQKIPQSDGTFVYIYDDKKGKESPHSNTLSDLKKHIKNNETKYSELTREEINAQLKFFETCESKSCVMKTHLFHSTDEFIQISLKKYALQKDNEAIFQILKKKKIIDAGAENEITNVNISDYINSAYSDVVKFKSKVERNVPYREVHKEIDRDNYYIGTDAQFQAIGEKGMSWSDKEELWKGLQKKEGIEVKQSPKSNSEYIIDGENIYRYANHWNRCASCDWGLSGGDNDTWQIGICALKDFSLNGNSAGYFSPNPNFYNHIIPIREVVVKNLEELLSSKFLRTNSAQKTIEEHLSNERKIIENDKKIIKTLNKSEVLDFSKSESSETKKQFADCIVRNTDNKVLLLQRSTSCEFMPGKWCLPGGHIDEGEDATVAAKRELFEEAGLNCQLRFFKTLEDEGHVAHYFETLVRGEIIGVLDNDEHYRAEWVLFSKLDEYDMIPTHKAILKTIPVIEDIQNTGDIINTPLQFIEELDLNFELIKKAFNEGHIDEDAYLSYLEKYNQLKSIEVVKAAFNENLITEEQYIEYIQKAEKLTEKEWEEKRLHKFAKQTPETELRRTIKEHTEPHIRKHAHKELARREKAEKAVKKVTTKK